MRYEEHCWESIALFGEAFGEVHKWLDEFAGTPKYGMRHRQVRHHEAGLREVERLFGADAVQVARQHIKSDLKEEGWVEGRDLFPKDERDYKRMGLF